MNDPAKNKDARAVLQTQGAVTLRAAVMDAVPVEFMDDLPPKSPKTPKSDDSVGLLGAFGSFGTEGQHENNTAEVGPFPVNALPQILREMVQETSRVTQTPDALGAIVALGILSASFGGGLLVRSGGGRITPPNLFLLGIARSGTGKSRAFGMVASPLLEAEHESLRRWIENEKPRIETALRVATRRAEAERQRQVAIQRANNAAYDGFQRHAEDYRNRLEADRSNRDEMDAELKDQERERRLQKLEKDAHDRLNRERSPWGK